MAAYPHTFLWGASTSPHQIEGNNINSDWWAREGLMPGMEPSGDADDSYHRYREDMQLLADAGLNAYRFGIEWARIEPRPGEFSNAELAHYRRMIDTALELGLKPVVTLHHFSNPRWFAEEGGWLSPAATDRFIAYVTRATEVLHGVEWVITINEPNMMAMMVMLQESMRNGQLSQWQSPTVEGESDRDRIAASLPVPTAEFAAPFIDAHHAVRDIIRQRAGAQVGWSIANGAFYSTPENSTKLAEVRFLWEDIYLEASSDDDFVGVQAYSAQEVDANGLVPHPEHPENTAVGSAYRPDALGTALRHSAEVTGLPTLVTENSIATTDDARRIEYTTAALEGLEAAIADGVDVRGYLHWSLLDNYEWGHWGPTFGLIAVDRTTFVRTPKPSLHWLGKVAQSRGQNA
ncbi:glycoside hydrolase family 1 protein [Microbacterium rhizomatis]|uniref:Glycoside hydrolase family 1 protein n=1 Tax=Microbacterium rhizomatis TaxID=1631477 RepID=A0A5J5J1S7_9MICO|nr:family 1 glycosylhydrolase [Microbacterium rhizomatis]KAA9106543.1 glycoside hydrolase family 1 protein [Microbacterium rhizomatis]